MEKLADEKSTLDARGHFHNSDVYFSIVGSTEDAVKTSVALLSNRCMQRVNVRSFIATNWASNLESARGEILAEIAIAVTASSVNTCNLPLKVRIISSSKHAGSLLKEDVESKWNDAQVRCSTRNMDDFDVTAFALVSPLDMSVHYGVLDLRSFQSPDVCNQARKLWQFTKNGLAVLNDDEDAEQKKVVCRAGHKLLEAFLHPFSKPFAFRSAASVAIDVGASPGGWSQTLSPNFERVLAIDPGDMSPMPANVTHVKKKVEDCMDMLKATRSIDALVCDFNASALCLRENVIRPIVPLLSSGAIIVLTVKSFSGCLDYASREKKRAKQKTNNLTRKEKFHIEIEAVMQLLRELGCSNVDFIHLFANTVYEQTVRAIKD